jgi:uncharacterized protein (TIRG00374 family)
MNQKRKDLLSFLGRFALSAGLLVWLFRYISWIEIAQACQSANIGGLIAAFVVFVLINVLCLVRWNLFMGALDLKAPLGQIFRYFFIGLFCNLFLPTSIGGDVVKAIGLSHSIGQKAKVFASIVLDRLSGFGGLVVLALGAYVLGHKVIDAPAVIYPVVALTGLSLAVGFMLFHDKVYAFCCQVFVKIPRLHAALMAMHADVVLMKRRKRTALGCVGMSIGAQILGAGMYYLLAVSLGQDVSFVYFLVFAPIVSAVSFLPSIGGLGVREMGWVYFLSRVGVDKSVAASLSLISFFFIILVGVMGGILYVTSVSDRRLQSSAADAVVGTNDA